MRQSLLNKQFLAAHRARYGGVRKSPCCQLSGESSTLHTSQVFLLGKATRQEKVGNGRCLDWPIQLPSCCRLVDGKRGLDYCRLQQLCSRAIPVELFTGNRDTGVRLAKDWPTRSIHDSHHTNTHLRCRL